MKTKELRLMRFQHNFQSILMLAILSIMVDNTTTFLTMVVIVIVLTILSTMIDNRRHEQEVRSDN